MTSSDFRHHISRTDIAKAIKERDNGALLHLRVKTGCNESHFPAGYNPWRQAIEIGICSAPQKGQANREIIEILRYFFKLDIADIRLIYGATSAEKGIWIKQRPEEAIARLNNEL